MNAYTATPTSSDWARPGWLVRGPGIGSHGLWYATEAEAGDHVATLEARRAAACAAQTEVPDAPANTTPTPANAATTFQVDYIMRMVEVGEHGWMSGPRDRAGVSRMTRSQASDYITALRGE